MRVSSRVDYAVRAGAEFAAAAYGGPVRGRLPDEVRRTASDPGAWLPH